MLNLTRQQQTILCVAVFLLATGWVVKTCRARSGQIPQVIRSVP